MNNAQHTPGPWRLELEDGGMGVFPTVGSDTFSDVDAIAYVEMIPDRDYCLVDDVARLRRDQEEAQANARLIAAAPELLAAHDPAALEAIANEICDYANSACVEALRVLARKARAAIQKALGKSES